MRVEISPRALDDLARIGDWIGRDNPARALSFVDELHDAFRQLRDFPLAYPAFPKFGATARKRSYGNYMIIYDVFPNLVSVIAVVHGARDLDRLEI